MKENKVFSKDFKFKANLNNTLKDNDISILKFKNILLLF